MRMGTHAFPGLLLTCLLSACGDAAGPDQSVLVGQFGAPDLTEELLATHGGVELVQACGSYFASSQPARPDSEGEFLVHGRWYPGGLGLSHRGAMLNGRLDLDSGAETVTLTLRFEQTDPAADPLTVTLRRGARFAGPELPCPAQGIAP